MKTKAIALLVALALLATLSPFVIATGDPVSNGLSSLEYRVKSTGDWSEWATVPEFSASVTSYSIELPREKVFTETMVEIRAELADTQGTRLEYNPAADTITKENSSIVLNAFVCTPEQTSIYDGIMTAVYVTIPTANPQKEDIVASLNGSISGKQTFGGEAKPTFAYNETIDLSFDGLGLSDDTEPIQGDVRYRVRSVFLGENTDDLWNTESNACSIDAATLTAGDHNLSITLYPEFYIGEVMLANLDEENEVPPPQPWMDYSDEIGTHTITGNFTIGVTPTTEPTTEPPTEPSTVPPTEPTTEPTTVPPTEPTTELPTEPTTELPTEPAEDTTEEEESLAEPPTDSPDDPLDPNIPTGDNSNIILWITLLAISGAAIVVLLIGARLRGKKHRG